MIRVRKIKCDEAKPFCEKCVKTGRACDGYESVFRPFPSPSTNDNHQRFVRDVYTEDTNSTLPLDATSLNRYFSTKTMFDVEISCNQEAEQVLQESLTNPSIKHALLSLRVLRETLESSGDSHVSTAQQVSSYNYGLQQYSKALTGLASNLSSPCLETLKPALLCCQVLISVEQVRGNFSAMSVHIIRGLNIMREYRVRPYISLENVLMPKKFDDLPFLDVFIIKLLAAPCMFTEQPPTYLTPPAETSTDRRIVPNMRTGIRKIADSVIEFLHQVSLVSSEGTATLLLNEKHQLLSSLEDWHRSFEARPTVNSHDRPESINDCFLRLLYMILRVVLMGSLDDLSDYDGRLKAESKKIQAQADDINTRLKDYDMPKGMRGGLRGQ